MSETVVFEDIGELLTLKAASEKQGRRVTEGDLSIIPDAAMVCVDGKINWVGLKSQLPDTAKAATRVSLQGQTVLPAFTECHTHSIFAGSRAEEFEWRQAGQTYQEISAKGGGILSTVKETRKASAEQLLNLAQDRADRFLEQGVTALEIKSGYALDFEGEIKCLGVARRIHGPKIVTTYLGAHSRSPDHADLKSYMKQMVELVLPRVARDQLADRVDIYIEKGFYDHELAKQYLDKVRELKLPITAHVEQLSNFGGTDLVLKYDPQSVDHLIFIEPATIASLAKSQTVAVLLPAADFYLKMKYPPARQLIDAGAVVALSTDFNPGTSPTQDLSLVGVLARIEMKMTLPEVIAAFTIGSASALGLSRERGALIPGKVCDFSVLRGSWRELFYSVGHHPIARVYREGKILYPSKEK